MKPAVYTSPEQVEAVERPERNGVVVTRREVDDGDRFRRLVALLADVLDSPDAPEEGGRQ